jgi:hypothetical protein
MRRRASDKPPMEPAGQPQQDGDHAAASPMPATDADLHAGNMARVARMLRAYTILKVGALSLIGVLLWRFFGPR